jgi:hypothetical protein
MDADAYLTIPSSTAHKLHKVGGTIWQILDENIADVLLVQTLKAR